MYDRLEETVMEIVEDYYMNKIEELTQEFELERTRAPISRRTSFICLIKEKV
jgi:hypothetical protein